MPSCAHVTHHQGHLTAVCCALLERRLKPREVKTLTQGHTTAKQQSQNSNPSPPASKLRAPDTSPVHLQRSFLSSSGPASLGPSLGPSTSAVLGLGGAQAVPLAWTLCTLAASLPSVIKHCADDRAPTLPKGQWYHGSHCYDEGQSEKHSAQRGFPERFLGSSNKSLLLLTPTPARARPCAQHQGMRYELDGRAGQGDREARAHPRCPHPPPALGKAGLIPLTPGGSRPTRPAATHSRVRHPLAQWWARVRLGLPTGGRSWAGKLRPTAQIQRFCAFSEGGRTNT